jgi:dCTP diphosphatase
MSDIAKLTEKIVKFRDARNWKQFHNPKDVALSLTLEAGEFMEHFQWKNEKEIKEYVLKNREAIGDELADVLYWTLLAFYDLGIDPSKALEKKLIKNEKKYPVEKTKGKHKKYTELE